MKNKIPIHCPCCGEKDDIFRHSEGNIEIGYMRFVYCKTCGLRTKLFKTEKEAVDAWNKRVKL